MIHDLGIVYAPDYVINAGGVINVADELYGYNSERALRKVEGIYQNIEKVLEIAERDNIQKYKAANRMAEERIERMRNSRSQFLQNPKHILNRRR